MRLSDILLMKGLVRTADLDSAIARQRMQGGRLGENLIALGLMTTEQLFAVMEETPPLPRTVADTGISRGQLQNLLLKFMRMQSCEILPEFSERMRLPHSVIQDLIDEAVAQKLVHVLGSVNAGIVRYMRYALSDQGRAAAGAAMDQTLYLGPAPVNLATWQAQVNKQKIANEVLDLDQLRRVFSSMVMSDSTIRKLAPAISAGKTLLLYGPPGNGKTSVGTRVASLFNDPVFIPYAIEVGGQIIKMFDESLHLPFLARTGESDTNAGNGVQIEAFDSRWAACKRPIAMAGGEMTLDMLDMRWDPLTKCYDAPLHMKALNGVFLIDDFGRQKVNPTDLLNRWIIPLENRIDYLKLNTGITFILPFDELVIFSTNLEPQDLMDPAFLRRIPYKIEMVGPTREDYARIFTAVAKSCGIGITREVIDFVMESLLKSGKYQLAAFQPKFLCDQAVQVCKCFGMKPEMTHELAADALENLYVGIGEG